MNTKFKVGDKVISNSNPYISRIEAFLQCDIKSIVNFEDGGVYLDDGIWEQDGYYFSLQEVMEELTDYKELIDDTLEEIKAHINGRS